MMFVVTNRTINENEQGLKFFGAKPNPHGPNELRLVRVTWPGGKYKVEAVKDDLTKAHFNEINKDLDLGIKHGGQTWHGSFEAAAETFSKARKQKKNIVFFVHGYNNDMKDVLDRARRMERLYGVVVVPFSWPANGGGPAGTAAYLSDKKDARASMDALNRFIGKVHAYHSMFTAAARAKLEEKAQAKFPDNPEARNALLAKLIGEECQVTLNLVCHSMGNYVLKYALQPSGGESRGLCFDNICLVAADVNNLGHAEWVEDLQARRRVFIVINENDHALKWARIKPGEQQLPRLGHYLRELNAGNAYYVDLTNASAVGNSHAYFSDEAPTKNNKVRQLFRNMFNGGHAEEMLRYRADLNVYRLP